MNMRLAERVTIAVVIAGVLLVWLLVLPHGM